jgi:hypothetical protein
MLGQPRYQPAELVGGLFRLEGSVEIEPAKLEDLLDQPHRKAALVSDRDDLFDVLLPQIKSSLF